MQGRSDRHPAKAHHEIGNGHRYDDQDDPHPTPGKIGPFRAPGRRRADHGRGGGDHDAQANRVPQQRGRQLPEQQRRQRGPTDLPGLEDEKDQGEEEHGRHRDAPSDEQARAPSTHSGHRRRSRSRGHGHCAHNAIPTPGPGPRSSGAGTGRPSGRPEWWEAGTTTDRRWPTVLRIVTPPPGPDRRGDVRRLPRLPLSENTRYRQRLLRSVRGVGLPAGGRSPPTRRPTRPR